MITVEVYRKGDTGMTSSPIATLFYSGKGNKVTVTTEDKETKASMNALLSSMLQARQQRRVSPDDRQEWMEALPESLTTIPYWYKIADVTDEITEEVEDADEIEEDTSEEAPDDGTDDGGDIDDGDESADDYGDDGDDPDTGDEYNGGDPNNDNGGLLNTNG